MSFSILPWRKVIERSEACINDRNATAAPELEWCLRIALVDEPRVTVRNSTRHVVVTVNAANVAADNLRIEGSGDRLLLIWRERNTVSEASGRSFLWEQKARIRAREVSLPADVDFNAANIEIVGRTLQLRLPKQPAVSLIQTRGAREHIGRTSHGKRHSTQRPEF